MDYVRAAFELAGAFFKAFAHAVIEYPLPTAFVFLFSFFVVWPEVQAKFRDKVAIAAPLQFVLTVFAANVVGWIFQKTLTILNFLFSSVQFSASIFVEHPIEFIEHFLVWSIIAIVILLYLAGWRYRNVSLASVIVAAFPVFYITYISANIHTHLIKEKAAASLATPHKPRS
jgi:hypothetical protein